MNPYEDGPGDDLNLAPTPGELLIAAATLATDPGRFGVTTGDIVETALAYYDRLTAEFIGRRRDAVEEKRNADADAMAEELRERLVTRHGAGPINPTLIERVVAALRRHWYETRSMKPANRMIDQDDLKPGDVRQLGTHGINLIRAAYGFALLENPDDGGPGNSPTATDTDGGQGPPDPVNPVTPGLTL